MKEDSEETVREFEGAATKEDTEGVVREVSYPEGTPGTQKTAISDTTTS